LSIFKEFFFDFFKLTFTEFTVIYLVLKIRVTEFYSGCGISLIRPGINEFSRIRLDLNKKTREKWKKT